MVRQHETVKQTRPSQSYRRGCGKARVEILQRLAILQVQGMMNENGVDDTQTTWIYGFNDDGSHGLHSRGLGRREATLLYGRKPGLCFQHNQMIKHGSDWEIQRQHVCKSKVHLLAIMHPAQLGTEAKSQHVYIEQSSWTTKTCHPVIFAKLNRLYC